MSLSPTIHHSHSLLRSITGTDPAAGDEISEVVPDHRRWKILTVRFSLANSSTPGDRTVNIIIDDGTNEIWSTQVDQAAAPNLTWTYCLSPIPIVETPVGLTVHVPFPHLILASGFRLRTNTDAMKVDDDYSAPQLYVEEWIYP